MTGHAANATNGGATSLLTFLGKSPTTAPSKKNGKQEIPASHAFMNTPSLKKADEKSKKRKAETSGGKGKKTSKVVKASERTPFDMTPVRANAARDEKTPDTEEKYPRNVDKSCKEPGSDLDHTSTKLLEDDAQTKKLNPCDDQQERTLIILDSPERQSLPRSAEGSSEGEGEKGDEPDSDPSCRRSQRIKAIASTGPSQKKEAAKRFFMSKEEKARLAEEEKRIREDEEREREEERKRMRVERAILAREKLREEMERTRQETQKLNQGKQINPFLLPRSLRPSNAKTESESEGDQVGLFRPSSFNGLAAIQDSNPEKFPFPIVSHILPFHAPTIERKVPSSDLWELRERLMETESDAPTVSLDQGTLMRQDVYHPLFPCTESDPSRQEDMVQTLSALTNTAVLEVTERISSLESKRDSFQANNSVCKLWTEAVRPQRSGEVVGNSAAVQDLLSWLQRSRDGENKLSQSKQKGKTSKSSWCSESDSDDATPDSNAFSNALVLVGPSGSGKTASLYACCEELRLRVIEINPSDQRTGKNILQMVGEATRSYLVRRGASAIDAKSSQESAVQRSSPEVIDLSAGPATPPKETMLAGKELVGETVKWRRDGESVRGKIVKYNGRKRKYEVYLDDGDVVYLCIDEFKLCGEGDMEDSEADSSQEEGTTEASLVLFEEVDVLMEEDKGFMAALTSLIEQTQVPVVLTCSFVPPAIKNLGLKETRFEKPSEQEIMLACGPLCLTYRKGPGQVHVMKRLQQVVRSCRGDLRASLMAANLEFAYEHDPSNRSCLTPVSLLHEIDVGIHQHRYEFPVSEEVFHEYLEEVDAAVEYLVALIVFPSSWVKRRPHEVSCELPEKKSRGHDCQLLDSLVDLTDTISMNDVLSEDFDCAKLNVTSSLALHGLFREAQQTRERAIPSLSPAMEDYYRSLKACSYFSMMDDNGKDVKTRQQFKSAINIIHPTNVSLVRKAAVACDYLPFLRSICMSEADRRAALGGEEEVRGRAGTRAQRAASFQHHFPQSLLGDTSALEVVGYGESSSIYGM
ncbi:chromosome fragility associated protein 1 [Guillardia theta CCMP2712]|uniref:Chromosome fragility associated protein 1 n=2 Tax=Guillardia theta TaxID=55529 RepID=L1I7H9_GUITC|nr:chromosome fragility associated protein 1 [Guillardia theta CCMP2712]EKX31834.1 chromosome fragility associated protein 1 [Guillardia theta CCMP2712]|eukprot:XP_005818814.1 chromosome fragility associated protein 1 [Guillardia theta CCMP2712]